MIGLERAKKKLKEKKKKLILSNFSSDFVEEKIK